MDEAQAALEPVVKKKRGRKKGSTNKKTKVDATDELNSREVSYDTRIISPIVYTFELKKTGDLGKISRRMLKLDKPLDFAF